MDHKLAIVIVPQDSENPVLASKALLEPLRYFLLDHMGGSGLDQRFRYKRVGGWFDGLVKGQVGQERWSTVLRMLLTGAATNTAAPFPGFGPESVAEIEGRIEADNSFHLNDLWPHAPCSIIVTPAGDWTAHPDVEYLDRLPPDLVTAATAKDDEAWEGVKRALFGQYHGYRAVAWDLSWHFIGPPVESKKPRKTSLAPRARLAPTGPASWALRVAAARRAVAGEREGS